MLSSSKRLDFPSTDSSEQMEQESLYKTLIAVLSEGIVTQAADGSILSCNASAERILGLTADQMQGRTSIDPRWQAIHEDGSAFPGDTHPAMLTLRTGQPYHNVIMGVHKPDGQLTWISVNSQPLFQADNLAKEDAVVVKSGTTPEKSSEPIAVVCTFVDISERKLLADTSYRNQEIYRSMVRCLPNTAILVFDHELRYIYAEGASLRENGFKREAVEGKTLWEVLQPEDAARILPYYQAALGGIENTFEEYYNDQVYLVKAVPVKDDEGRILAGMLVTQDITDIKQAELQASAEKDQLAVTLRSIGDGVITTDLSGKVTLVNRVAESLTGWSQAEAVGQPIDQIFKIVDEKTALPAPTPIYQTLIQGQTVFFTRSTTSTKSQRRGA